MGYRRCLNGIDVVMYILNRPEELSDLHTLIFRKSLSPASHHWSDVSCQGLHPKRVFSAAHGVRRSNVVPHFMAKLKLDHRGSAKRKANSASVAQCLGQVLYARCNDLPL